MANGKLVSILIAAYNHSEYVIDALNSCLCQDSVEKEILFLDDGSIDDTFKKACEWKKQHEVEFVRLEFWTRANRGVCASLNELISQAHGEYIVLLASDDMLLPGSIFVRFDFLEKHPETWAVFGDAIGMDREGRLIVRSCLTDLNMKSNKRALSSQKFLLNELIFRWNISGPVLMIRKQAYDPHQGVGIYDEGLYFEDRDMYLRLAMRKKLAFIDVPVARYRILDSSMSRSINTSLQMRNGIMASNRKARKTASGLSKAILHLFVVSGEGRWKWRPRVIWYPIAILAIAIRLIWLTVHDCQVWFGDRWPMRRESRP